MQKKLILGAIVAALLAFASVSLAFAGGRQNRDRDRDGDEVRILRVTLKHGPFTELDHGDPGPTVGDRLIFFGDVYRNDKRVGVGGGECVTMQFTPGPPEAEPAALTDHCAATLSLAKGQIAAPGARRAYRPRAAHAAHHRRDRPLPHRPRRAGDGGTGRGGK